MRQMLDEFKEKPKSPEDSSSEDRLETSLLSGKEKRSRKKEQFRERTAGMTRKEKIKYIIYYYKWIFLAVLGAVIFVTVTAVTIYNNSRPYSINAAVINPLRPMEVNEYPFKAFAEDKNLTKGTHYSADVYYNITINYQTGNVADSSRASALSLQTAKDTYDVIIADVDGLEFSAYSGIIYTLESTAGNDYLEKYKDRLYYTSDYSSPALAGEVAKAQTTDDLINIGNRDIAVGIDISDTQFAKDMNFGKDKVYICIATGKQKRIERACMFIDYILNEYK